MSDQKEGEKQEEIENTQSQSIGKCDVLIIEREIKNEAVHRDKITGAQNLNEEEFMTCSQENSFKVWSKKSQSCVYTIETHEPLHTMAVTGEKGDMLVAALGQGNLIVFGMELKNQIDIINEAHLQPVIKVISLGKLANKYFATRCAEGHVNVWSATTHPDKLFTIEHIDREDTQQAENAMNLTIKPEQQDQFQQSIRENSSSAKDRMIELKWNNQLIQQSSTVLCTTNYNDSLGIIVAIDLKTRKKTIIKTFQTSQRPSFVYQVDSNNILIGTEGGFIEQWVLYEYKLKESYQAHPGSEEGVSSIIELNTSNYLLWGDIEANQREQYKLLATAAKGCSEFKIWKFTDKLIPHMKVNTSCSNGINYLLQTTETQIVAVDHHKTLRFYNFVDHKEKSEEEEKEKDIEKLNEAVRKIFIQYDQDLSGYLEQKELLRFLGDVFQECYGKKITIDETLLNFFDLNKDQKLSRQEVRYLVQALRRDHILKV